MHHRNDQLIGTRILVRGVQQLRGKSQQSRSHQLEQLRERLGVSHAAKPFEQMTRKLVRLQLIIDIERILRARMQRLPNAPQSLTRHTFTHGSPTVTLRTTQCKVKDAHPPSM
ncbi:MAG: hypothetical protein ACYTCU_01140 [Planctomycetota bacterium]